MKKTVVFILFFCLSSTIAFSQQKNFKETSSHDFISKLKGSGSLGFLMTPAVTIFSNITCANPVLDFGSVDANMKYLCEVVVISGTCRNVDKKDLMDCTKPQESANFDAWDFIKGCASGVFDSAKDILSFVAQAAKYLWNFVTESPIEKIKGAAKAAKKIGSYADTIKLYLITEYDKALEETGGKFSAVKKVAENMGKIIYDSVTKMMSKYIEGYGCLSFEAKSKKACYAIGSMLLPPAGFFALLKVGAKAAAQYPNLNKALKMLKKTDKLTPDKRRVQNARKYLSGKKLSKKQGDAIIDAHNVGAGEIGKNGSLAAIGNYTQNQIRRKARLLKEAGFSPDEIRKLMENGIVGLTPGEVSVMAKHLAPPLGKINVSDTVDIPRSGGGTSSGKVVQIDENGIAHVTFTENGKEYFKKVPESQLVHSKPLVNNIALKMNDKVNIPRSSGGVSQGRITHIDANGNANVVWTEGGQQYSKTVSMNQLTPAKSPVQSITPASNVAFKMHDEVNIPRSSGGVSQGRIANIDADGNATVVWTVAGQEFTKSVPLNQLTPVEKMAKKTAQQANETQVPLQQAKKAEVDEINQAYKETKQSYDDLVESKDDLAKSKEAVAAKESAAELKRREVIKTDHDIKDADNQIKQLEYQKKQLSGQVNEKAKKDLGDGAKGDEVALNRERQALTQQEMQQAGELHRSNTALSQYTPDAEGRLTQELDAARKELAAAKRDPTLLDPASGKVDPSRAVQEHKARVSAENVKARGSLKDGDSYVNQAEFQDPRRGAAQVRKSAQDQNARVDISAEASRDAILKAEKNLQLKQERLAQFQKEKKSLLEKKTKDEADLGEFAKRKEEVNKRSGDQAKESRARREKDLMDSKEMKGLENVDANLLAARRRSAALQGNRQGQYDDWKRVRDDSVRDKAAIEAKESAYKKQHDTYANKKAEYDRQRSLAKQKQADAQVRTPSRQSQTFAPSGNRIADSFGGQPYNRGNYFTQYMGDVKSPPVQGWKVHVSASEQNAQAIAELVLPELRQMGVMHKVVTDHDVYKNTFLNPTNSSGGANTQLGKFITIYPSSTAEAQRISQTINRRLRENGISGRNNFPRIPGEKPVGDSGGVFARYGEFFDGGQQGLFRTNQNGFVLNAHGSPIKVNGRQINVNDLTDPDSVEFQYAKQLGASERDVRGTSAPSWAPNLD